MVRPWLRVLAGMLLALAASAQLGTLAHLVLVPHVRCAEHAAIEHAHEAHGDEAADAPSDHAPSSHHDALHAASDGDHGHDACSALALCTVATPAVMDATSRDLPRDVALAMPRAHAPPHLVSRALELAPKTSPPA